jgi:hypothetical protein
MIYDLRLDTHHSNVLIKIIDISNVLICNFEIEKFVGLFKEVQEVQECDATEA